MNIDVYAFQNKDLYSLQIWEYFYSYKQYQSFPKEPAINVNFCKKYKHSNNLKILHLNFLDVKQFPKSAINNYDIILVDNDVEHLSTNDTTAIEFVNENKNVYFLVGSFVHNDHRISNKILTLPRDWFNCQNWYSNPKTFVKYSNHLSKKTNGLLFIGGRLKTYRKYILDVLPNELTVMQNSRDITNTPDAVFGDLYDRTFIDTCNNSYICSTGDNKNIFYEPLRFGFLDKPIGYTPIGYWLLPEYNTHKCIVYPEASMLNNEVYPTEKTWKCVVSKTHWIMFAGMNAYSLMKENGIRSILELVPGGISFDSIADHKLRFKQQSLGIEYLLNNKDIFNSTEAYNILINNFDNFFIGSTHISNMVNKLDDVLKKNI